MWIATYHPDSHFETNFQRLLFSTRIRSVKKLCSQLVLLPFFVQPDLATPPEPRVQLVHFKINLTNKVLGAARVREEAITPRQEVEGTNASAGATKARRSATMIFIVALLLWSSAVWPMHAAAAGGFVIVHQVKGG